jgi:hypothetical protein
MPSWSAILGQIRLRRLIGGTVGERQNSRPADGPSTETTTQRGIDLAVLESRLGPMFAGEPWDEANDALLNLQSMPIGGVDHAVYSHMVDGYRLAADTLVDDVVDDSGPLDLLVYPILVLYRHHIELALKQLFHLSGTYLELDHSAKANHKLVPLWEEVMSRLERIPPGSDPDPDGIVDLVVHSFNKRDGRATTFRYADVLQANVSRHTRLNVGQLRMQVGRASKVLGEHSAWLLELLAE